MSRSMWVSYSSATMFNVSEMDTVLVQRMLIGFVFLIFHSGADSASIRVLQHIHEQCQRVMLILATRPIRDYNATFINDFTRSGSHSTIELNGLGADEIGEIILQTFQSAVHRVSPEIVRVIQVREYNTRRQ